MSLETDIHQTKSFRSEYHKLTVNILFTSGWVADKIKDVIGREHITIQQYNILRILRGAKTPISTLQIRERMLDKMSDTSRLVDRLVRKGLAQKRVCTTDKRMVDVTISELGLIVLARIDQWANEMDQTVSSITEDEAFLLNKYLDKIRSTFKTKTSSAI